MGEQDIVSNFKTKEDKEYRIPYVRYDHEGTKKQYNAGKIFNLSIMSKIAALFKRPRAEHQKRARKKIYPISSLATKRYFEHY